MDDDIIKLPTPSANLTPINIPDIFTRENQEKFRRKLSIASRLIAILLIGAIFFIGYIQIAYVKDMAAVKEKYGSMANCYLCGKENLRTCECQYLPQLQEDTTNISFIAEQTAQNNILPCPDRNGYSYRAALDAKFTEDLAKNITIINPVTNVTFLE